MLSNRSMTNYHVLMFYLYNYINFSLKQFRWGFVNVVFIKWQLNKSYYKINLSQLQLEDLKEYRRCRMFFMLVYMPVCVIEVAAVCICETVSYVFKCRLCSHVSEKIKRTIDTRYIYTVLVHTFDRHFHAISVQTKSLCFWRVYMSFIVTVVTSH